MTMSSHVWATSMDGKYCYKTLTSDRVNDALAVMRDGFMPDESVFTGLMLAGNQRATQDVMHMCRLIAADGASLVAVEMATGRVVGVAFNKIQPCCEDGEASFIDVLRSQCSDDPAFAKLMDYFVVVDTTVDVYERYKVKALLELMYIGVLSEFRGNGLAKGLVQATEDTARGLAKQEVETDNQHGQNVRLVLAVYTSSLSQRIGRSLGWDELVSVGHDKFEYRGKKFSERIGPQHPDNLVMAKKISID